MEWLEQIKAVFRREVDGRVMMKKRGKRSAGGAIKELHKESKLPYRLLSEWYFGETSATTLPICKMCNKHPVATHPTGKIFSKNNKKYGLCNNCIFDTYKKGRKENA